MAAAATVSILLLYAGLCRWLFTTDAMNDSGGVVSLAFVCSVPFTLGVLSVGIGRSLGSDSWDRYAVFWPFAVLTVALVICLILQWEAAICVLMAAPILYFWAFVGGTVAHVLLPRNRDDRRLLLTFAVFLPLLVARLEGALRWPTEIKAIENSVTIQAPAQRVWPEITSVRAIPPEQISTRWIYLVGFPKPISATLDREGVGGVRTATFERGVSFFETVTTWEQLHTLAFTIHADPNFIPHTAFDQHIIVGGRFYDVLDGIYEIEPVSAASCRLHLTSRHRLGTRFNAYAGWWSEWIMDEIQGSILEVIRRRAEGGCAAASDPADRHRPRPQRDGCAGQDLPFGDRLPPRSVAGQAASHG